MKRNMMAVEIKKLSNATLQMSVNSEYSNQQHPFSDSDSLTKRAKAYC
jgi:hypothetical protein